MLRKDIAKRLGSSRDTEELDKKEDIVSFKSGLKYVQFHEYIDKSIYDEWKWMFNYIKDKDDIDSEYVSDLNIKFSTLADIANKLLSDTVAPRMIDIDKSTTPTTIDGTVARMEMYHTRNKEAIDSLNIDTDLKISISSWNDDMYNLVLKIKRGIRDSIVSKDEENMDNSVKGTYVSVKVKNYEELSNWFKEQGLETIKPEEMHCTISYSRKEFHHKVDPSEIVVKPDQLLEISELGSDGCIVLKYNSPELQARFNQCITEGAIYDYDSYIPHITIAIDLKDKSIIDDLRLPNFDITLHNETVEELDLNWKAKVTDSEEMDNTKRMDSFNPHMDIESLVYTPVQYADIESFAAISGVVSNGFKKVSSIISNISSAFTSSNTDYSNLTKGFIFSKDKNFQDVYNELIGVPAGFTGYLLDVSKYTVDNLHYIDTLNSELDNLKILLSSYINSADYRESFTMDLTKVKTIENIAKELYDGNSKYITNSREDHKSIGKLIRSANEIDDIVDVLKTASKILDIDKLEDIKNMMKQVDDLVSVMISNKNVYTKNKLLEIAKSIDAIIALSNGVATVVYLKNTCDTILEDIKATL